MPTERLHSKISFASGRRTILWPRPRLIYAALHLFNRAIQSPGRLIRNVFLTVCIAALFGMCARRPIPDLPTRVYWAWERPEDLSTLNTHTEAVAYLAATLYLTPSGLRTYTRRQGLRLPANAVLIPVIRIEENFDAAMSTEQKHILRAAQLSLIVSAFVALARSERPLAIQIDYDAPQSARDYYARLLRELRRNLPESTALSMTALASWCVGDPWLRELTADDGPVQEVVPMLFRMGADGANIYRHIIVRQNDFTIAGCRTSVGLILDERHSAEYLRYFESDRRIYFFSAQTWSPALLDYTRRGLSR